MFGSGVQKNHLFSKASLMPTDTELEGGNLLPLSLPCGKRLPVWQQLNQLRMRWAPLAGCLREPLAGFSTKWLGSSTV
jgi:hypothetical protein